MTPAETLVEIARLMATLPEELRTPWVNLNSSDAAVRMLAAAGGAQVTHYYVERFQASALDLLERMIEAQP